MSMHMSISITDVVIAWRKRMGLTQSEAAALIGVSQPVFNRIEGGTRFPDKETARIFVGAGVFTPEQLGWAIIGSPPVSADAV